MDDPNVARDKILVILAKMEGKMDLLVEHNKNHTEACDPDRKELRDNMKALEKKQSWILGGGSALAMVAALIVTIYNKGGP